MNIEKEKALASFKWLDSQRLIFMICFFAGSIGVIVLRELNFGTVVAVAYAGLVMLAYVLFGATKKYLLRPDLLGDNTYYLGFLFTLVSLAYTLYRYTSSQNEVDQIIQNFGVALSTTLLGLVGRVYFNQTQEDPATYEKAVRMSLAEEASNLIGETAKIRTDVSVLRTSIQQTIEEGVKSSLEKLSESMKEITDSYRGEINKSSEKINQSLESNLEGFTKSVAATNQAIENSGLLFSQAISGFNQTSDELILEIKKLVSNVQKIDSIDDAIGNKILGPLNQFQSTVESVKISVDESKSAFIELTTNARQATDSLKLIGSSGIGDTATHLENLNKKLSEAIEDISKTSKSFGELTTILVNSSEKMPSQLKTFEERYQEFNKRIQEASVESQESLLALQKSLILVANKVVEGVSKNG